MRAAAILGFVTLLASCARCDGGGRERELLHRKLEAARPSSRVDAARALAPKATREEVLLVARVLQTSDAETREALVTVLGQVPGEAAVDPLGEVALSDDSDGVRATAIRVLLAHPSDKAKAWLPRAFASAGPKGRAAFVEADPALLASLVSQAGAAREGALLLRVDQPDAVTSNPSLRAAALRELGWIASPEADTRLRAFLSDPDEMVSSGAALGMANSGEAAFVPLLEERAAMLPGDDPRGLVAAYALARLDASKVTSLQARLADVDDGALDRVAEVLAASKVALSKEASARACERLSTTENVAAVAPLRLLAPDCAVPPGRTDRAAAHAPRLVWAGLAAQCRRELVDLALEIIAGEPEAPRSIEAARYVGRCGARADAEHMLGSALAEIDAAAGVVAAREQLRELWAANAAREAEAMKKSLEAIMGPDEAAKVQGLPTGVKSKLEQLLGGRTRTSEMLPLELRPSGHAFVAVALVESFRLGADVAPAVDRLLSSRTAEVRGLVLALADLRQRLEPQDARGAALDAAFERLREDPSSTVRRMWLEAVAPLNRASPEVLLTIAAGLAPEDRPGVLPLLATADGPVPAALEKLVRTWSEDPLGPRKELAPLLARLGDEAAVALLGAWARSVNTAGATDSVRALGEVTAEGRAKAVDGFLIGAALHPDTGTRVAAIAALAKGCRGRKVVRALAADPDRGVKAALQAYEQACAGGRAP